MCAVTVFIRFLPLFLMKTLYLLSRTSHSQSARTSVGQFCSVHQTHIHDTLDICIFFIWSFLSHSIPHRYNNNSQSISNADPFSAFDIFYSRAIFKSHGFLYLKKQLYYMNTTKIDVEPSQHSFNQNATLPATTKNQIIVCIDTQMSFWYDMVVWMCVSALSQNMCVEAYRNQIYIYILYIISLSVCVVPVDKPNFFYWYIDSHTVTLILSFFFWFSGRMVCSLSIRMLSENRFRLCQHGKNAFQLFTIWAHLLMFELDAKQWK